MSIARARSPDRRSLRARSLRRSRRRTSPLHKLVPRCAPKARAAASFEQPSQRTDRLARWRQRLRGVVDHGGRRLLGELVRNLRRRRGRRSGAAVRDRATRDVGDVEGLRERAFELFGQRPAALGERLPLRACRATASSSRNVRALRRRARCSCGTIVSRRCVNAGASSSSIARSRSTDRSRRSPQRLRCRRRAVSARGRCA